MRDISRDVTLLIIVVPGLSVAGPDSFTDEVVATVVHGIVLEVEWRALLPY